MSIIKRLEVFGIPLTMLATGLAVSLFGLDKLGVMTSVAITYFITGLFLEGISVIWIVVITIHFWKHKFQLPVLNRYEKKGMQKLDLGKIKVFLETLQEYYPERTKNSQIRERLNLGKSDYKKIVVYCNELKYIDSLAGVAHNWWDDTVFIKITSKGIDFLEDKKLRDVQSTHSWVMVAATIVISVATVASIFVNINLVHWTQKSAEPFLIPRDPQLLVRMNTPSLVFNQFYFADNRTDGLFRMNVCFTNEGRGHTGHIWARWNYSAGWLSGGGINIDDIEGGNSSCQNIPMRAKNCMFNEPVCDYKSIIPVGSQIINLTVDCQYCIPRQEDYQFNICIWQNSSRECNY